MFFIIGTLPAAVKLCSFSGLLWTQIWGLMFISSYMLIEGLIFISGSRSSHLPSSVPEVLGYSPIEWQLNERETLRHKIKTLMVHQRRLEIFILLLAVLIHVALSIWALQAILLPLCVLWKPGPTLDNIFKQIAFTLGVSLSTVVVIGFSSLVLRIIWRPFKKVDPVFAFLIAPLFLFLTPLKQGIDIFVFEKGQPKDTIINRLTAVQFFVLITVAVFYGVRFILLMIFRKFPAFERMLLMMPALSSPVIGVRGSRVGQDHESIVTTCLSDPFNPTVLIIVQLITVEYFVLTAVAVFYGVRFILLMIFRKFLAFGRMLLMMPAPSSPVIGVQGSRVGPDHESIVTTSHSAPSDPIIREQRSRVRQDHKPIMRTSHSAPPSLKDSHSNKKSPTDRGVEIFIFFLWNLCICIVWYLLNYDPSGTVNPAWTDIFG
jgi:hypothetical protein